MSDFVKGIHKYPLLIFPEGVLQNGQQITQFKVGSFINLNDVMPFTVKIDRGTYGTSSDIVNEDPHWGYYLMCCSAPIGTI